MGMIFDIYELRKSNHDLYYKWINQTNGVFYKKYFFMRNISLHVIYYIYRLNYHCFFPVVMNIFTAKLDG